MQVTLQQLEQTLSSRFHGVLKSGKHDENGECCALELLSVCKHLPWTDNPKAVNSFDLRNINDINVSDEIRTKHLLPVIAAYSDSLNWSDERQKKVVEQLVIKTVNILIAELPGLSEEIRANCRNATTLNAAADAAAAAAYSAAAAAAAYSAAAAAAAADAAADAAARTARTAAAVAADAAADAAARAARTAADAADVAADAADAAADAASAAAATTAAATAAAEKVFIQTCEIWLMAAQ